MRIRALIVSFILLLGCAPSYRIYKSYPGPILPLNQVSAFDIPDNIHVSRLDGMKIALSGPSVLLLLPGKHSTCVYYYSQHHFYSHHYHSTHSEPNFNPWMHWSYSYTEKGREITLTWEAEPGHIYTIDYNTNMGWFAQQGTWVAWIKDFGLRSYNKAEVRGP